MLIVDFTHYASMLGMESLKKVYNVIGGEGGIDPVTFKTRGVGIFFNICFVVCTDDLYFEICTVLSMMRDFGGRG